MTKPSFDFDRHVKFNACHRKKNPDNIAWVDIFMTD
jgi:hypothetical protein